MLLKLKKYDKLLAVEVELRYVSLLPIKKFTIKFLYEIMINVFIFCDNVFIFRSLVIHYHSMIYIYSDVLEFVYHSIIYIFCYIGICFLTFYKTQCLFEYFVYFRTELRASKSEKERLVSENLKVRYKFCRDAVALELASTFRAVSLLVLLLFYEVMRLSKSIKIQKECP